MSSNRFRNVFTLESPENSKRHQNVDVFEKDPFKVQSYNFRYAERPAIPLPVLQPRVSHTRAWLDFQTHFYNGGTPNSCNAKSYRDAILQNDKRVLDLTKFQEYRNRRLLNDSRSFRSSHTTGSNSNSSSLIKKSNTSGLSNSYNNKENLISMHSLKKENYNATLPQIASSSNMSSSKTQSASIQPSTISSSLRSMNKLKTFNSADISESNRNNFGSSCEININIKGSERNRINDNFNIKIGANSIYKNLNMNSADIAKRFNETKDRLKLQKSDTFIIDKTLSKFALNEGRKKTQMDRVKEISSIYSPKLLAQSSKTRYVKSIDRLPSIIPTNLGGSRENHKLSLAKLQHARRKYLIQKVKSSLNDFKRSRKYSSQNNLNKSSYNLTNNASTSSSITVNQSSSKKFHNLKPMPQFPLRRTEAKMTAPIQLFSTTRLPFNVNINVYADRMRLPRA